jgi:uncharacterized membrane protein
MPVIDREPGRSKMKATLMPIEKTESETATKESQGGAFCYGFGALVPLVYLSTVPRHAQDPFLRFHCIECLLLFFLAAPLLALKVVSVDLCFVVLLLWIAGYFLAMLQAGRGKRFHLPLIGWVAEHLV